MWYTTLSLAGEKPLGKSATHVLGPILATRDWCCIERQNLLLFSVFQHLPSTLCDGIHYGLLAIILPKECSHMHTTVYNI